ncbi:MAG: DUF4386 family protein [Paraglaciecola sp.]|nr:DUF4386 family protein [Paraglaciecola sp.]
MLKQIQFIGGSTAIVAALSYVLVFSYLALTFGYPDVLDQPAHHVLPALLNLGDGGRAVWALYAMLPLLLIPTALALHDHFSTQHRATITLGLISMVVSACCMTIGLIRWPTLMHELATVATNQPELQPQLHTLYHLLNLFLGKVIGEFLGELFLNTFLSVAGLSLVRSEGSRLQKVSAYFLLATASLSFISMFRNIFPFSMWVQDLINPNPV